MNSISASILATARGIATKDPNRSMDVETHLIAKAIWDAVLLERARCLGLVESAGEIGSWTVEAQRTCREVAGAIARGEDVNGSFSQRH